MSARFLFAVCQAGAERALKNEVAREHPTLRFAFSRPGFVTFRLPREATLAESRRLNSVFARTWGWSLGKVSGQDDAALAHDAWSLLAAHFATDELAQFRHLHVWQRERPLLGDEGFDAAALEPAQAVGALLLERRPELDGAWSPALNEDAAEGELVLECILVERHEGWLGWHRAQSPETRWPGGVPAFPAPERLISRAYFKILEAPRWSELPVGPGDRCIEIGSAPGGSCLALLERGCLVTGIDPAEMDPAVLAHPNFTHLRTRAKEVERSVFRDCRWLVMDAHVAPNYTLDTLQALLAEAGVRPAGLVLTLKLTDPALTDKLPDVAKRINALGYRRVRMRQLAFNRQEVCAVATERG
jgi:23S rRNA (cytidine2498-2'-O)-methyltransferase